MDSSKKSNSNPGSPSSFGTIEISSSEDFPENSPLTEEVEQNDMHNLMFLNENLNIKTSETFFNNPLPMEILESTNQPPKSFKKIGNKRERDHFNFPSENTKKIIIQLSNTLTDSKTVQGSSKPLIRNKLVLARRTTGVKFLESSSKNQSKSELSMPRLITTSIKKIEAGTSKQNDQVFFDITDDDDEHDQHDQRDRANLGHPGVNKANIITVFGITTLADGIPVLLPSKFHLPQTLNFSDFAICSSNELYGCKYCNTKDVTINDLAIHYFKTHFKIPIYECPLCNAFITIDQDIMQHHLLSNSHRKNPAALEELMLRAIEHPDTY